MQHLFDISFKAQVSFPERDFFLNFSVNALSLIFTHFIKTRMNLVIFRKNYSIHLKIFRQALPSHQVTSCLLTFHRCHVCSPCHPSHVCSKTKSFVPGSPQRWRSQPSGVASGWEGREIFFKSDTQKYTYNIQGRYSHGGLCQVFAGYEAAWCAGDEENFKLYFYVNFIKSQNNSSLNQYHVNLPFLVLFLLFSHWMVKMNIK